MLCVCGFPKPVFFHCCQVHSGFPHPFQFFVLKRRQRLEKQNFKDEGNITKKLRGKDQLEYMTKRDPALKASEEAESRDCRGRRERKISRSKAYGLNVTALSFPRSAEKTSVYIMLLKVTEGKRK